jgi:hypothetical protein
MLNKPGNKGNANQDPISLLLQWLPSRTQTTTNVGEDVRIKEPSCTAGGNVNKYTTMENSMEAPQKAKNRTAI